MRGMGREGKREMGRECVGLICGSITRCSKTNLRSSGKLEWLHKPTGEER
jgi:hypothetical protein